MTEEQSNQVFAICTEELTDEEAKQYSASLDTLTEGHASDKFLQQTAFSIRKNLTVHVGLSYMQNFKPAVRFSFGDCSRTPGLVISASDYAKLSRVFPTIERHLLNTKQILRLDPEGSSQSSVEDEDELTEIYVTDKITASLTRHLETRRFKLSAQGQKAIVEFNKNAFMTLETENHLILDLLDLLDHEDFSTFYKQTLCLLADYAIADDNVLAKILKLCKSISSCANIYRLTELLSHDSTRILNDYNLLAYKRTTSTTHKNFSIIKQENIQQKPEAKDEDDDLCEKFKELCFAYKSENY